MGDKYYYKDGTSESKYLGSSKDLHRTDGPAIEHTDGSKSWYVDGRLHRTDGPAVILSNGYRAFWLHGVRHRINGPAIEYVSGSREWYIDGEQYSEQEFETLLKEVKSLDKALRLTDPREWVRKL